MSRSSSRAPLFLLFLVLLVILLRVFSLSGSTPQAMPRPSEIRGVWLTNVGSAVLFRPWGVNQALHQLAQLNFNTVYPVVWNRGYTLYPSAVMKRVIGETQDPFLAKFRLGRDVLQLIAKQGRRQGLRVIPWFEYGFMAPAASELVRQHPDWLTQRQDGGTLLYEAWDELEVANRPEAKTRASELLFLRKLLRNRAVSDRVWLNPLHPQVQAMILDLIVEVVNRYDVAGIQLDDHFGLPVAFGYDPFTVQLYQQEHSGKLPPSNPRDPAWMRWRADKLSQFVGQIFQEVKAIRPDCLVTLSPNSQGFSYATYLQDWKTWVERGWIEELVLQVYRDNMPAFLTELNQSAVQAARQRIPVSIGILSGSWGRPVAIAHIQQQVEMARAQGFSGISFFYWESLWGYITPESPRKRRAVLQSLFSSVPSAS